jgi:hypothetical protein
MYYIPARPLAHRSSVYARASAKTDICPHFGLPPSVTGRLFSASAVLSVSPAAHMLTTSSLLLATKG